MTLKGALRAHATTINEAMKLAAVRPIADHAPRGDLIPDILDTSVHNAVAEAALKTCVMKYSTHLET